MDVLLTVDCVGLGLFAGFCLMWVIPACNKSVFRLRLWEFRDEVADEIRAGGFSDAERARELVCLIEEVIEFAGDVSAGKLLVVQVASRGHLRDVTDTTISLEGLEPHDRARLASHRGTLEWAMRRHMLTASPLGWVLLVTIVPLSVAASAVAYIFDQSGSVWGNAKARLRNEIDPRAALLDHRPDAFAQRELSQMV
jgi:hypothetical protein